MEVYKATWIELPKIILSEKSKQSEIDSIR